ncbi:3-beta hydroxysteroid dehydrogenase [Paenibacillus sp. CFBP13512]|uniref:SDR family oxidoreductase n=1 Tax=Paenibacillus sp. CFBP13512 TaxID=2184007 RepID=UPI0010C05F9F|nr:SDR family oxidoreductase [Paenibacillus sp. CFBP13512]TKJ89537.1 3-beta hydroxysteroid dehydrogenase [Paenibacillus sp. CFBP13512]
MRVFVTGANGFIGTAVIQELIQAGHQVTGLVRSTEGAHKLTALGATAQQGNVESVEDLRRGVDNADGVIHTAFFHKFSHASLSTRVKIVLGGNPRHAASRFMAIATETDRRAIETLGKALSGEDRSLVMAFPTMALRAGSLATENDPSDPQSVGGGRTISETTTLTLANHGVRSSVIRIAPLVHGIGDQSGLLPTLISIARKKGVSAYVADGANRWPAVHRLDTARLFRLALEYASAGSIFHAVGEEGVPFRDIAHAIGRYLNVPVSSIKKEQAGSHFGWLGAFVSVDNYVSSAFTQERLDWKIQHPDLFTDMEHSHYF